MRRYLLLLTSLIALGAAAADKPVPLFLAFDGESRTADGRLKALGKHKYHGTLKGDPEFVDGIHGKAMRAGKGRGVEVRGGLMNKMGVAFSATVWLRVDKLPGDGRHWLFGKGANNGWQFGLNKDGRVWWHGFWGGWYHGPWSRARLPVGKWCHVALTFQKGGHVRAYIDGKEVLSKQAPYAVQPVGAPLQFGLCNWEGAIDDIRLYAAALTPKQVEQDRQGKLATRPATTADVPMPPWTMRVRLGRFDRPIPFRGYVYPRHAPAVRRPGPNAVDWPTLRLSTGAPVFADRKKETATDRIETQLIDGGPWFRAKGDPSIEPVNHWFRALNWRWGQQHVYTTDRTARSWGPDYEIWGFPVRLAGTQPGQVKEVLLRLGKEVLYQRKEVLDSLTLILPSNLGEHQYELQVNGEQPQKFDVKLKPIVVGAPQDELMPVQLTFGDVSVVCPAPHEFTQQKQWDADVAALGKAEPEAFTTAKPIRRRSPVKTFIASMSHGMSGGQKTGDRHIERFNGDNAAYAKHMAALGFDTAYEKASPRTNHTSLRAMGQALRAAGVNFGVYLTGYSHSSQLGGSNIAFYAALLPDWGDNLIRDLHLAAQYYGGKDGGGIFMGTDNAGYVPYWDWAPPIPNRPWGRALLSFMDEPVYPVGPQVGARKSYERNGTQKEFLAHVHHYDTTWANYGRFAREIAEISPDLPFTTGSFGSGPGVGGRGGWPWASVPGGDIYEGFQVQTAYDWNEVHGTKALHNLALVDRLRSVAPVRETWTIVDDFALNHGPQTLVRDWAVVLSRGVKGIGTNFLAHDTNVGKKTGGAGGGHGAGTPASVREENNRKASDKLALRRRQMAGYKAATEWAHVFGGSYANMKSAATVGIVYSDDQAVSRHINNKDPEGPHEGKTVEALILCHMAGWPARLVTTDEIKRGLDPQIKALFLVGLNRIDNTWVWHEDLKEELQAFVKNGGRVLRDHESDSPVDSVATGLKIAAYTKQGSPDQTPWLQHRNRPLVSVLQKHLAGVDRGPCHSTSDTIWVFPSVAGDCTFVTVANYTPAPLDGAKPPTPHGIKDAAAKEFLARFRNACREVKPIQAKVVWNVAGPIYDAATGIEINRNAPVALTRQAVRLFVIPKDTPKAISVAVLQQQTGTYQATATIPGAAGLPIAIELKNGKQRMLVDAAAGFPASLPLTATDYGKWKVSANWASLETATAEVSIRSVRDMKKRQPAYIIGESGIRDFGARRKTPLVIALTAEQATDKEVPAQAKRLQEHFTALGRNVRIGRADASDVVLRLQPIESLMKRPQWYTIDADLILIGHPKANVLLNDQLLGKLLPPGAPPAGTAQLVHTWSPFRGRCHAVNVIAADDNGLKSGVGELIRLTTPKTPAATPAAQSAAADSAAVVMPNGKTPATTPEPQPQRSPWLLVLGAMLVVCVIYGVARGRRRS